MPFASFARSSVGKARSGYVSITGNPRLAIDGVGRGGVIRGKRSHLERVVALCEPALDDQPQLLGRGLLDHAQRSSIAARIRFVHLAGCQHVGLAAEAADPLEALDETGAHRHPGAIELGLASGPLS